MKQVKEEAEDKNITARDISYQESFDQRNKIQNTNQPNKYERTVIIIYQLNHSDGSNYDLIKFFNFTGT